MESESALARWTGWPLALTMSLVAAIGAWIAGRAGPGVSADSADYVSIARHLASGRGFVDFTGHSATNFPPLFPWFTSLGIRAGMAAPDAIRLVNSVAFAAIVLLSFALARRILVSAEVAIGVTVLVAFSPVLLRVSTMAWSEPLFAVWVLAWLVVLTASVSRDTTRRRDSLLLVAAFCASAAFMTRYAGVAIIGLTFVIVLVSFWRDDRHFAVTRALGSTVLAAGVPLLWYLHNRDANATDPLGPRVATGEGPTRLARLAGGALSHLAGIGPTVLSVLAILVVLALAFHAFVPPRRDGRVHLLVPTVLAVLGYTLFAVVSRRSSGSDLSWRILVPMWVPLIALGGSGAERILDEVRQHGRERAARSLAATLIACIAVFGAISIHRAVLAPRVDNLGVTTPSPLADAVARAHPSLVVGNSPWRVSWSAPDVDAALAFTPAEPGLSHRSLTASALLRAACHGSVLLAWYRAEDDPAGPELGGTQIELQHSRTFSDGTLSQVVPESSCGTATR
jgi:4-amino-4-deoxy-L-arabinose transferase-like glycosyltransferase